MRYEGKRFLKVSFYDRRTDKNIAGFIRVYRSVGDGSLGNDDGVTIEVPVSLAPAVSKEAFDWLVPGMFKEKIEALN
ncbi:MAG: DUF3418 domain-containing protein, partial [Desulfobacterales bacterium]